MGLFRYVLQGFGWEIGAHAAREGIEALEQRDEAPAPAPPSRRELAKQAKAKAKAEARKRADIERQLASLKKRVDG